MKSSNISKSRDSSKQNRMKSSETDEVISNQKNGFKANNQAE